MAYCIYLRKSRHDPDAEAQSAEETLARHKQSLLALAARNRYAVGRVYQEVASGDRISDRKEVQKLLSDVGDGIWDGVLVMAVDRLARGNQSDQALVFETFASTDTLIITPDKTIDPNDPSDEDLFDFGLFMARHEYKLIKRRLQCGRIASVNEGKFVGNKAPYGYDRVKLEKEKGWTLSINPEEAKIVRLIFDLYTVGEEQPDGSTKRLGTSLIVRRLNDMHIPTKTGSTWVAATIRGILDNPVYIGKIRWNHRKTKTTIVDGRRVKTRPRNGNDDCMIAEGRHEPIIDQKTWELAQQYLSHPAHPKLTPVQDKTIVKNPLAGLVVCAKCGRVMQRRPYGPRRAVDTLICPYTDCDNISSDLQLVEERILDGLKELMESYRIELRENPEKKSIPKLDLRKQTLQQLHKQHDELEKRKNAVYTSYETGVYTVEEFTERINRVKAELDENTKRQKELQDELDGETKSREPKLRIVQKMQNLLEVYHSLPNAKAKNDMLKEVLSKVVYEKNVNGRWHHSPGDFTITLYPKLQY